MRLVLISGLVLLLAKTWAQPQCSFSVSGQVLDKNTQQPLALAEVFLAENNQGTLTDSSGYFRLSGLCPKSYTLTVLHVGCQPYQQKIVVNANLVSLKITLDHSNELLPEAVVKTAPREAPPARQLQNIINLEEAQAAELRFQKTGENVIKPVIRSFSGNRVSTWVGEVELQDQQWGSDHGLSLSLYPDVILQLNENAQNFGQVRLSGNAPFTPKQQFFSRAFSNARGAQLGYLQNVNLLKAKQAQGPSLAAGYRFQVNRSGDRHAPNYQLSNTGSQSLNAQVDLAFKAPKQNFRLDLSTSYDAKNLAVLRASHVGNVSDFNSALAAPKPLFEENFTYELDNPRQATAHFIASATAYYFGLRPKQASTLKLHYSYQNNQRQEFEARRGGNENPALDLRLQTHQLAASLKQPGWQPGDYFQVELRQHFEINSNNPNTGFEPILPNFNNYKSKLNAWYAWRLGSVNTDSLEQTKGLKLSLSGQYQSSVAQYFQSAQLRRQRFNFPAAAAQIDYQVQQTQKGSGLKISYQTKAQVTQRPPAVNELLISGVHHGTASIEEGNPNLQPETKYELSQQLKWQGQKFSAQLTAYAQYVRGYIFQSPLAEPRLTIRGAFPVFAFSQTNAFLAGAEAEMRYAFTEQLSYQSSLNYIFAQDLEAQAPLPLVPPFEWFQTLRYAKNISTTWQQANVSLSHRYVGRQFRFNPSLDLAPPPTDYSLLEASIGISLEKKYRYVFSMGAQNLTNRSYRNYLNRFRYFTDAPGINLFINCLIKFK